ncbi:MAG: hypothetical protein H0V79_05570 [Actinobacteria bacterium]|nr:hypothetical protein [Actinomycetota bacterium]
MPPGEVVRGTVVVVEGGSSRTLEVSLNYREQTGDDYEDTPVTRSGGPIHTGDLTTGASYQFEIPLPGDALPNFKSKHGELWWEVDARSDERGRDTHERQRIEVVSRASNPVKHTGVPPVG